MADQMDKQSMLRAIQEAMIRRQNGEDPQANPSKRPNNPVMPDVNIDIGPRKPDPEVEANAQIERAAGRPSNLPPVAGGQYGKHTLSKKINPETGMPYFSDPDPVESDPEADALREMRMQMLQNAAQTGKFRK